MTLCLPVAYLALRYELLQVGGKGVSRIIVKDYFYWKIECIWTQCRGKIWVIGKSYGVLFGCYDIFVSGFYILKTRGYEVKIFSCKIMMIGKYLNLHKRLELLDIPYKRLGVGDARYYQQTILVTEVFKIWHHPGVVGEYRL